MLTKSLCHFLHMLPLSFHVKKGCFCFFVIYFIFLMWCSFSTCFASLYPSYICIPVAMQCGQLTNARCTLQVNAISNVKWQLFLDNRKNNWSPSGLRRSTRNYKCDPCPYQCCLGCAKYSKNSRYARLESPL